MQPQQFKRTVNESVSIAWDDGKSFTIPLRYLRDRCPCASCSGETVLWREYKPNPLAILTPGKYELKSAEIVGNYAIALTWSDGHNTGLYAFDFLRRICEEYDRADVAR